MPTIIGEPKFDFNDIAVIPAITSNIVSRNEIQVSYNEKLSENIWYNISPIIVSPMDTVINEFNFKLFISKNMMVCLPRGLNIEYNTLSDLEKKYVFYSYSLVEFVNLVNNNFAFPKNVLIDIANGNMNILRDVVLKFKDKYRSHKIMAGNVANPETYRILSEVGADYIRCGIGAGNGCLTSEMTAIHYPMASLIQDIYLIKNEMISKNQKVAMIVADGGFKGYSDIIKGLALGSDFIMLGSILNKCIESSGDSYLFGIKLNNTFSKFLWNLGFKITKKFRGMSTKEVQRKWGINKLRASEGVVRYRKVEYTFSSWFRNFEDYLKSCMSYTGINKIEEFIGKPTVIKITNNSFIRFNK